MGTAFFTARTAPANRDHLLSVRAGASWVYCDSIDTFRRATQHHAEIAAKRLGVQFTCTSSFAVTACRQDPALKTFEREYILYLLNLGCSLGSVRKFLAQGEDETIYACYFSAKRTEEVAAVFESMWQCLASEGALRFKHASTHFFHEAKGSYYWAKALLEHLVYLGLAAHPDQWSVCI